MAPLLLLDLLLLVLDRQRLLVPLLLLALGPKGLSEVMLGKLAHVRLVVEIVVDKPDLLLNRLVQLRRLMIIQQDQQKQQPNLKPLLLG